MPPLRRKISPRYMIVELLTGLCFALAVYVFGLSLRGLLACAVLGTLIPLAFIDADEKIIPDRFVIIILVLGIANTVLSGDYVGHIIGFFVISLPFLAVALITGGMGGGDVKLMAAAGLYLGWAGALLSVISGSVAGAAVAVYLLASKKAGRKSEIPFGPFLAAGIAVSVLFGDRIIGWYLAAFF
jgi:leader peptidase (prepilin peptidase)/N-methyltransferase